MYHDKTKLVNKLYEILDGLELEGEENNINIDKVLTPLQKYNLILIIARKLPTDTHGMIREFNERACIKREVTHVVGDFDYARNYFLNLLIDVVELGFAFGMHRLYMLESFDIITKGLDEEEKGISNAFEALINILFRVEYGIDVFNLTPLRDEGIKKVHESNMTKFIKVDDIKTIKESVTVLSHKYSLFTNDLKNGYVTINNRITNDILRPTSYKLPDLEILIFNYLNKKENEP